MASLPPVKLDTHEDWFNLLMTVLHQQAEQNPYEEYREMAQKLIDQFMRYGRPFVDSDHAPCVALRMYPKEAGNTIWLLLLSSDVPEGGRKYHLAVAALPVQSI